MSTDIMEISSIILTIVSILSLIINILNEILAWTEHIEHNSVGQLIFKNNTSKPHENPNAQ